jgi:hypothetical protein
MVHTVDRPFDEMMLGLEAWIPIYMTGQISSYYLKNVRSSVYQHLNYVSGAAALTGECIAGYHNKGKYYLTKKSDEIAYYCEKSELILKKAQPLIEIYRSERCEQYQKLVSDDALTAGKRHGILSAPPIYTMPDDLLTIILSRNNCSPEEKMMTGNYVQTARNIMSTILKHSPIRDEIPRLSPDEFALYPAHLSLEGLFWEKKIPYSYDEYCQHLNATSVYADNHENYSASFNIQRTFWNMQIFIHEGEFAVISKSNTPVVHFVVRQPRLREAIENMVLPIIEAE